jgi:UDP-N-acetylglucosamine 2-epimerase (hydrolysing)
VTKTVLLIFGTRPEAIKMAPVIKVMEADNRFDVKVVITAQHREMLDQVLNFFNIIPDYDLDSMTEGQTLEDITVRVLKGLGAIVEAVKPDIVVVHGDTTTTLAAALSAFYHHVPVAHVEAGMRTGDINRPFPEEMNRLLVAQIARWSFAPSAEAEKHLLCEGINPSRIVRTSHNTGVDALLLAQSMLGLSGQSAIESRKILVTAHRRESWGEPMEGIFFTIASLAKRHADFNFQIATHANPIVAQPAHAILGDLPNVTLLDPQPYGDFVKLMATSRLILSDSGGIQEEGATLGVPVLVLRDKTEYHELLDAGLIFLAGTDVNLIQSYFERVLDDEILYQRLAKFASERVQTSGISTIVETLARV